MKKRKTFDVITIYRLYLYLVVNSMASLSEETNTWLQGSESVAKSLWDEICDTQFRVIDVHYFDPHTTLSSLKVHHSIRQHFSLRWNLSHVLS